MGSDEAGPKGGDSLAQQAAGAAKAGRIRRFLGRMPHAVIAAALVILVARFGVQGPALFLAGAVKRFNWRHALIMAVLGVAVTFGLESALARVTGLHTLFPVIGLVENLGVFLSIGAPEMALARRWRWRRLGFLVALGLGAICLFQVVNALLYWSEWRVRVPYLLFGSQITTVSGLIYYPLLAVAAWIIVPWALAERSLATRRRRYLALGAVVASIGFFVLFFGALACPLARWSLTGSGPQSKHNAAYILEFRGRDSDFDFIRRVLEEADWTEDLTWVSHSERWPFLGEHHEDDWRKVAVDILAKRDPAGTADWLSGMLRARPASALAHCAAKVLGANRRYETAPLLLRYAMVERGDSRCTEALEAMRVPQAALPRLLSEIYSARMWGRFDYAAGDCDLSSESREALKTLLGTDAGPKMRPWAAWYDENTQTVPTPLDEAVRADADRVVVCMNRFIAAKGRMGEAARELGRRSLAADGQGEVLDVLREWYTQRQGEDAAAKPPAEVIDAAKALESRIDRASAEIYVKEPDWSVPTTDALEKEVDAYIARVDAMVHERLP